MWPPAKIITIKAAPMASGGITPVGAPMTVQPIVRTRKKVPISSQMYLFMMCAFVVRLDAFTKSRAERARKNEKCFGTQLGRGLGIVRAHLRGPRLSELVETYQPPAGESLPDDDSAGAPANAESSAHSISCSPFPKFPNRLPAASSFGMCLCR